MRFIDYILEDNFIEAKKCFDEMLADKMSAGLKEEKEELEEIFLEDFGLLEAVKRNPNIIKMGRIKKIRRRIRRNAKGRIVVQKNVRRSGVKGYRISGNTVTSLGLR